MKRILLILVLSVICLIVNAQGRAKFGKVSLKEIRMQYYAKDSSASAVILSDYGYFKRDEFKFSRHVRIKILTKNGLGWGNWTLRTPSKGFFKGRVFNYSDGKVEETKLEESTVHRQQIIEDIYIYKIFMPDVKVGSVIDIKYSYYGLPYEWRFQDLIPVVYSELEVEQANYLKFKKDFAGTQQITVVKPDHWICRDMPAFVMESNLNHYSNYLSKVEFELLEVRFPGWSNGFYSVPPYFKEYTTSWEKVGEYLDDNRFFGHQIRSASFLNKPAKEIVESSENEEEIVRKVYSYVKNQIKWNGIYTIYSLGTLKNNFEVDRSGSISEINLALISMLKKTGIKTWPVVLSTRSNGMLLPHSASIDKLNYVVAYIEVNGKELLLDAARDNLQPGILSEECLNGPGWLVDKENGRWIDLMNGNKKYTKKYTQIKYEDGKWSANMSIMRAAYDYLDWCEERKHKYSNEEYFSQFEKNNQNLEVYNYSILKNDSTQLKASEKLDISLNNFVVNLGNEAMIDPYLIKGASSGFCVWGQHHNNLRY